MKQVAFVIVIIMLFFSISCQSPAGGVAGLDNIPGSYKIKVPGSLDATNRSRGLDGNIGTGTFGQEVIVHSLNEIEERSGQLSTRFVIMDKVIETLDGTDPAWQSSINITVTSLMIEQIKQIEGGSLPQGVSLQPDQTITIPGFIYVNSTYFSQALTTINNDLSDDLKLTLNTGNPDQFDWMIIIDEVNTRQTDVHNSFTSILWNSEKTLVRVMFQNNPPTMPDGEMFKVEYTYNSTSGIQDLMYYYYDLSDDSVMIDARLCQIDSAADGITIDFMFSQILGEQNHNYQFYVQGYADKNGGYTELKGYYNDNINRTTYWRGEFGRSREQFDSSGQITSVMGFNPETASSIDDWFVLVPAYDPGSWDDSDSHSTAFTANFSQTRQLLGLPLNDHFIHGTQLIDIKIPDDLIWDADEFEKWFVVSVSGDAVITQANWGNVIAQFGITNDKYNAAPGNFVVTAPITSDLSLLTTYDLHRIETDQTDDIDTVVTTSINLSGGVYQ